MRFWRLKEYILITVLFSFSPVFGGQCQIDILNEKNSGEKVRLRFKSKLNSKKQCQKLAQMHRPNYNPDQVKLKLVNYHWIGPEKESLKSIGKHHSISKRTKKRKHSKLSQF